MNKWKRGKGKGLDLIKEKKKGPNGLKKNEKAKHVWQVQICIGGLMPKHVRFDFGQFSVFKPKIETKP